MSRRDYSRGGERVRVECQHLGGDRYRVHVGTEVVDVTAQALPQGRLWMRLGDRTLAVTSARAGDVLQVRLSGHTWSLKTHRGRAASSAEGTGVVEAPMTGTLLDVFVTVGQKVEIGEPVALLSAMKMEHRLTADVRGVVVDVCAAGGENVTQGELLVRIEPAR